jgi:hypothetical protein
LERYALNPRPRERVRQIELESLERLASVREPQDGG